MMCLARVLCFALFFDFAVTQLLPADCSGSVLVDAVAGTGAYNSAGLAGSPLNTPLTSPISHLGWNGSAIVVSEGSTVRLISAGLSATSASVSTITAPTFSSVIVLTNAASSSLSGFQIFAFDSSNCVMLGWNGSSTSSVLAGTPGSCAQGPEGVSLSGSLLNGPSASAMALSTGILYFSERERVRGVQFSGSAASGIVQTVMGTSTIGAPAASCTTDVTPAVSVQLASITALTWDAGAGRLYVADLSSSGGSYCIRALDPAAGMAWAIAGGGVATASGAPSIGSLLGRVGGMAVGISSQTLFFSQPASNLVRVIVNLTAGFGRIYDVAGDGSNAAGPPANGVPALNSSVGSPEGLAWDATAGRLLLADPSHAQVRGVMCVLVATPSAAPSRSRTPSRSPSAVSATPSSTASLSFGATPSPTATGSQTSTRSRSVTRTNTRTPSTTGTVVPANFPGFQTCPSGSSPVIRRAASSAIAFTLNQVSSLVWNAAGKFLVIADNGGNVIRRFNDGLGSASSLLAGDATDQPPIEGDPADQTSFGSPYGLAYGPSYDALYAGSSSACAVYRIASSTGIVERVLGTPGTCSEPAADYIDALDVTIEPVTSLAILEVEGSLVMYTITMAVTTFQALYAVNLTEAVPTVRRIMGSTTGTTTGYPQFPTYCDPFSPWAMIDYETADVAAGLSRSGKPLMFASGGYLRTVNSSLYQTCYSEIGSE